MHNRNNKNGETVPIWMLILQHWMIYTVLSPEHLGLFLFCYAGPHCKRGGQRGLLLIQVSCKTFEAWMYLYEKSKNSFPGLQEGRGGSKGMRNISTPCNDHSALLNKAVSSFKVPSWGVPAQDNIQRPRHRDRNNLTSDTNVEICQQAWWVMRTPFVDDGQ